MITLSMATACIGTGGNGVIVDEGTGWREGGRERGRKCMKVPYSVHTWRHPRTVQDPAEL